MPTLSFSIFSLAFPSCLRDSRHIQEQFTYHTSAVSFLPGCFTTAMKPLIPSLEELSTSDMDNYSRKKSTLHLCYEFFDPYLFVFVWLKTCPFRKFTVLPCEHLTITPNHLPFRSRAFSPSINMCSRQARNRSSPLHSLIQPVVLRFIVSFRFPSWDWWL